MKICILRIKFPPINYFKFENQKITVTLYKESEDCIFVEILLTCDILKVKCLTYTSKTFYTLYLNRKYIHLCENVLFNDKKGILENNKAIEFVETLLSNNLLTQYRKNRDFYPKILHRQYNYYSSLFFKLSNLKVESYKDVPIYYNQLILLSKNKNNLTFLDLFQYHVFKSDTNDLETRNISIERITFIPEIHYEYNSLFSDFDFNKKGRCVLYELYYYLILKPKILTYIPSYSEVYQILKSEHPFLLESETQYTEKKTDLEYVLHSYTRTIFMKRRRGLVKDHDI